MMQTVSEKIQARKAERSAIPVSDNTLSDKLQQRRKERINIDEQFVVESRGGKDVKMGFVDRVLDDFTGNSRETKETEDLPEVGQFEGFDTVGQDFKIGAGLLATQDPKEQMQIIEKVAPGTTFREDEKGNIFGQFKGQEFVLNRPGASFQDVISGLALLTAFGATAAPKLVGAGITKKIAANAAAGAGTSLAIDQVAEASGAEQSGQDQAIRAATAGAIEGAIPIAGAAFNAGKRVLTGTKKAPVDALPTNSKFLDQAEEAVVETGVDLFPAQKTLVPSELETQSFVASLPGGAQNALTALEKQNKQVAQATEDFLQQIAKDEVIPSAPKNFKEAANTAIEARKVVRAEKASPLYNEAFEKTKNVNTSDIVTVIDGKIADAVEGGEVKRSLQRVKRFIGQGEVSLKRLHNAKLEIDQLITKTGDSSLGNTTKREVLDVQNQLLNLMDEQSPLYKQARETFEANSPLVNELKDGVIGKVDRIKDVNLKDITSAVFDSAETSPRVVQKTRAVIDSVDPEIYDNLLRVELEKRLGTMPTTLNAIENLPGQIRRAVFGNVKQRRVLLAALRPQQRQQALFLETVLKRASLGRPGGSQTSGREEIKKEFSKGAGGAVRAFLRTDITKPLELAAKAGEDAAIQSRVKAISELMYNPDYTAAIKGIRELEKTNKKAAYTKMEKLLEGLALTRDKLPIVTERQMDQSS